MGCERDDGRDLASANLCPSPPRRHSDSHVPEMDGPSSDEKLALAERRLAGDREPEEARPALMALLWSGLADHGPGGGTTVR